MVDPELPIELAAIAVIVESTVAGGGGLFPGPVCQVPPQADGFGVVELAKPLKAAGAEPPLNEFRFAHSDPQNVT